MKYNKRTFLFILIIICLILVVSTVNASDNSYNLQDNHDKIDINVPIVKENELNTNTLSDSSVNSTDTTRNNLSKKQKIVKKSKTIIITNETFDEYFTDKYLNDKVSEGDILDFQGNFIGEQYSMYINKAVNITSTTNDVNISLNTTAVDWFGGDDVSAFTINKDGAYTNVSNLYFYNSQIFVKNSNHIIFNNITAIVDSQVVGRGVGHTSIRDNSSFVIVENSTFSTRNHWAGQSLVLAWANNCTIRYNKIYGYGQVGNLFYIKTFNVDNLPYDSEGHIDYSIVNVNNTFENNYLEADTVDGMNYAICISGSNNRIINNTVKYDGACINIQAYMHGYDMNSSIINNTLIGGNFISPNGSVIINNTVTSGYFAPGANCILENNNVANLRLFYDNITIINHTVNNIEISGHKENITIENCTINNNITVKGTSLSDVPLNTIVKNSYIGEYILLNGSTNLTLTNNTIGQQVIIAGRNNYNKNLSITGNNITTDKQYTVIVNTTVNALNISDNLLLTNDTIGNDTIYFKSIRDSYIAENNDYITGSNKLTDTNYLKFFNDDSTTKNNALTPNMTLELASNIYNKDFTFTTANITFTNPDNYTIYNATINITDKASMIINGLIINNSNKENVFTVESSNNQILNTKIYIDSDIDQKAIILTGDNNSISNITINATSTPNSMLILAYNTKNLNITNSQMQSDKGYGININQSQNIQIDNNYVNVTADNTVNIMDSDNINVTNNQLYAKKSLGDGSVRTIQSTSLVQDNNINNNIATITGNLTVYTPCNITVKITDSFGNTLNEVNANVTINNHKFTPAIENGTATIAYTPLDINDVNISVIQSSPNKNPKTINATLKVNPISTKSTLTPVKGLIGQTLTINTTVKDAQNNNAKDGTVTFTDNTGKTLGIAKVSNGVASINISYKNVGIYNITSTYSSINTYKSSTATTIITISNVNIAISGHPIVFTNSNITVKTIGENDKLVTTGNIRVRINNIIQNVTFKNAIATISYTPQNTNTLNVSVTYTAADKFTVNKTATLNVNPISTITTTTSAKGLVGQKITINTTVKDANNNNAKDGTVTFTDNTGKILKTVKVTNGMASTIVSYTTAGVYNITATYTNSNVYKTSNAKATITIGKVNLAITGSLTALTKGDITVKVTDENNKAVPTGSVAVKVNNVAQTVSFKNGVATISYTPQNT
ncbi:MAG: Ig-like domain repeat protein, partial [Methanosphaera stadtmanae]|nr:Ig-like domain repeat protein [Methanosphaera stadtmanae]